MADKTTSNINFTLANPLPKTIRQVVPTTEEKDQDVMLKIVLNNYEEREQRVMVENEDLRRCLYGLYSTVQVFFVLLLGYFSSYLSKVHHNWSTEICKLTTMPKIIHICLRRNSNCRSTPLKIPSHKQLKRAVNQFQDYQCLHP